jgi:hypothetical protein
MGLLAIDADVWMVIGTTLVTVVFLLVPGLVFSWYALKTWIDDDESYTRVIASIEKR